MRPRAPGASAAHHVRTHSLTADLDAPILLTRREVGPGVQQDGAVGLAGDVALRASPGFPPGLARSFPLPIHSAPGGLTQAPRSCRRIPAEASTYGDGRREVSALSSTYGPRGDVEPMAGLAVRLRALGAELDTVAVVAEGRDALVETGMIPTGVWL